MRLTRLGRFTTAGLLVLGAFACGQASIRGWEPQAAAVELEPATDLPGTAIRVVDLTGTAAVKRDEALECTNIPLAYSVTWHGGSMSICADWGTFRFSWTEGAEERAREFGEMQPTTVVLTPSGPSFAVSDSRPASPSLPRWR